MLHKIFSCGKWGGAAMLLFSFALLATNLNGQCPKDLFAFEIVKIPPADPWRTNTSSTVAGSFHALYKVNLKSKTGGLPAQFTFNHLLFEGVIKINNFTSRINDSITNAISQTAYFQYLDFSPIGEIVWEVGSANNCEPGGGGNGVTLFFPLGAQSVTLFTICVEAVPGDQLRWNNFSGYVDQCTPNTTCDGQMDVQIDGGSTVINFPPPTPVPQVFKNVIFEYGYDLGLLVPFVRVGVVPLPGSGQLAKLDGLIHIVPEMATASLDLNPSNISGGPPLTRSESRENADGSFDIYFAFENFVHPDSLPPDTLYVMAILLDGIYNLSQGGILHCSLTAGRWAPGNLSNNPTTYQLASTPTDIDIPGHEPCANNFTVTGSTYQTANDCEAGIRFILTHDKPTPLSLQFLKLEFIFGQNAAGEATPGTPVSNLPDAANSGSLYLAGDSTTWVYAYVNHGTINNPILIANGMYVIVPFDIDHNCVDYHVTLGEADPTPGAGNGNSYCALDVALGDPLCDPEVTGSVFLPNTVDAPYYRVRLKDFNSPYSQEENTFCEPEFSFCPDQSLAPFFLQVETNPLYEDDYLCVNAENTGVTTYDLVLIQKHLKNSPAFSTIYQRFAADADGDFSITTDKDIPEFRKLILGVYDNTDNDPDNDWPDNNAPSWWYINESIDIPSVDSLHKVPQITPQHADTSHVPVNGIGNYGHFYAVKLGDLNFTCNCNHLRPLNGGGTEDNVARFVSKYAEVRQEGNTVFVPVYADAPFSLIALQGGFRFDPSVLGLVEVIPNPELPVYPFHFGLSKKEDGELRFAWSPEQDLVPLAGKSLLFTLKFELKTGPNLPQGPLCWASDNIMKSLAYQEDGTEFPVRLAWENVGRERQLLFGLVVSPNPFEESVTAFIYSEKALKATLRLSDNRGTVYDRQSLELQSGDNAVQVRPPTVLQPGVYSLVVEVEGQRLQRKVVKI